METALDVLSRAATMVQDNANESRLTTKELPTAKWRRERRLRAANEYQQQQTGPGIGVSIASSTSSSSPPTTPPPPQHAAVPLQGSTLSHTNTPMTMMMAAAAAAAAMRPLCESTNRPTPPPSLHHSPLGHHGTIAHSLSHESPIDMTVSSSMLKQRSSPPPPYREPLPGTTYAASLARPSVITQAPSKRISVGGNGEVRENLLISNRENDNRSTESISMCETVIDEHFRRSLGADYVALFGAKKSPSTPTTPSPQPPSSSPALTHVPSTAPALTYPALAHKQPTQQTQHATVQQQQQQQQLISPKPTALLLSPTIIAAQGLAVAPLASQSPQHTQTATLPPPQQQPLALQRRSSSVNARTKSPPPAPQSYQQPQQPLLVLQRSAHSPTTAVSCSTGATVPVAVGPVHSPSTSTAVAYSSAATTAPVRIKTEPDITTTSPSAGTDNTTSTFSPPASPTASSYCTTSETPSVDDHFAKALGDTWKQLQAAGKDQRK